MTTLPSQKLNIAIIGGGLIGPRHAQSIIRNPHTNLIALVDPAPHGLETATALNTAHFPSVSSMLTSPSHLPQAAIICTPNSTHVPIALELIKAGIPILVEKPISTSIPSGLAVISAAKHAHVKLLVGHHRRFNPYLLSAKRALDSGSLGQIIAVQGCWSLRKPAPYFDGLGEWRRGAETGGVVLINLIHELDLLQYLLGRIVRVAAMQAVKTRGFDAEEGAVVILKFERGVLGSFVLSDVAPSPWAFEAGTGENPMIPKVGREEGAGGFYRVLGTKASLSVPDLTRWSYEKGENGGWSDVLVREALDVDVEKVPFDLQLQHFVDVVRNGHEPNCSGEEGLSAMVACEAVKRAMTTGQAVEIDGFEIIESGGVESRSWRLRIHHSRLLYRKF